MPRKTAFLRFDPHVERTVRRMLRESQNVTGHLSIQGAYLFINARIGERDKESWQIKLSFCVPRATGIKVPLGTRGSNRRKDFFKA